MFYCENENTERIRLKLKFLVIRIFCSLLDILENVLLDIRENVRRGSLVKCGIAESKNVEMDAEWWV